MPNSQHYYCISIGQVFFPVLFFKMHPIKKMQSHENLSILGSFKPLSVLHCYVPCDGGMTTEDDFVILYMKTTVLYETSSEALKIFSVYNATVFM
jgi:hypothetical protein